MKVSLRSSTIARAFRVAASTPTIRKIWCPPLIVKKRKLLRVRGPVQLSHAPGFANNSSSMDTPRASRPSNNCGWEVARGPRFQIIVASATWLELVFGEDST